MNNESGELLYSVWFCIATTKEAVEASRSCSSNLAPTYHVPGTQSIMAKSKAKKMKMKVIIYEFVFHRLELSQTYNAPNERYLVIVNAWTSHAHPSQTFVDNVGGWIERMLCDDWPGTRVDMIYFQRTVSSYQLTPNSSR